MKRRAAFTMLELFVVIAVIGILVALLAPAVASVREAGRAAKCLNNLRQLGLATHQYEAAHNMFPGWRQEGVGNPIVSPFPPADWRMNSVSIQAQLLPYLDQTAFFEELNLSKGRVPDPDETAAPEWDMLATAMKRKLAIFLCPSDGGRLEPGNNYRGCLGSGPHYKFSGEFPDSGNGFFAQIYDQPGGEWPLRAKIVTDGLAQTAMYSERLLGSGDLKRFDPRRDAARLPSPPTTIGPTIARCRTLHELALAGAAGWNPWLGRTWLCSGLQDTVYNHTLPPNSAVADCLGSALWLGPSSARSGHPGGVHVAFGDGAARFVSDSIDLSVWRALATRNGGETVLVGSY